MKQKISITLDNNLLRQIDKVCENRQMHRSRYIEILLKKDFEEIPVLILTSKGKLNGKPKSLIDYNGKKIIDHQLKYLRRHDFYNINVATDSRLVEDYIKRQYKNVNVLYEKDRLTSSGSIKKWGKELGKQFLVMHGDIIAGIDLKKLVSFHQDNKSSVTLVLKSMYPYNKYGVAVLEGSRVYSFSEKPEKSKTYLCYIGISIFNQAVLDVLEENQHYTGQLNKIYQKHGYVFEGFWQSFKTLDDLKRIEEEMID